MGRGDGDTTILRVLFVADDAGEAGLLAQQLERTGYAVTSECVADASALRGALTGAPWDIVLADHQVPGLNALDSLAVLREVAPDTPCIVVSEAIGEEAAVGVLKAGAQDLLIKGHWARLAPAVERELGEARQRRRQRASLESSELRFRTVVESMGEGLILTDVEERILYANPRMGVLTGRSPAELEGQVAYRLLMPEEHWARQEERNRRRLQGVAEEYETEIVRPDGERRWVRVSAAPSRDAGGTVVGTIGSIADVTERRSALERVRRLNAELQETAAAYHQLANFGARIERLHDIDALLDAGLEDLARQLRLDLGVYYLIEGGACHVARLWGAVPDGLRALQEQPMPVGTGLVGTVAASGEGTLSDYPTWEGALPEFVALGLRTQLTLPVKRRGVTVGVISLAAFGRKVDLDDEDRLVAEGFVKRLENALERVEYIRELTTTREQTFRALGVALEYRDYETKGHTDRVVERALAFGRALGMRDGELQALQWGAYLHDLGKIAIPDDILLKPGRLTAEEYAVIKNHTVYGYEMTRGIPFLPEATRALIRNHHERWQGDGYPDGLARDAIPLEARMFSLVDVYDALMSRRPYKRAWTHAAAVAEIGGMAGTQFDPELTGVFLELVERAPHRA
jgi:PAS domain S-box-containing protein